MKKITIAIIVSFVILMVSVVGLALWSIPKLFQNLKQMGRTPTYKELKVTVPHGFNKRTLVVYNFRPHGDKDAKYYAIGFARALADRIYCAPTGLTQQMSTNEIGCSLSIHKFDSRKPVSDAVALEVAKGMGVCWVITGDMAKRGSSAILNLVLTDMRSQKSVEYTANGSLNDLPAIQSKLIKNVIQGMELKPTPAQIREVYTPNFTRPQTLEVYGRSYLTSNVKECEAYRWQALDNDPNASFPVLRLLEFYYYGPSTIPEIQSNKRLAAILAGTDKCFPNNSHISVMKGLLLSKQCRYAEAEEYLSRLVEADPQFIRGRTAYAYTAACRRNANLAANQRLKLVSMWPNNAYLHAMLASSYGAVAGSARRGHYYGEMTREMKSVWEANSEKQLHEAVIAVTLDPDCTEGWNQLLNVSLQLGRSRDMTKAFDEMVRIDPKNQGAYLDYAFCFAPQWGGSERDVKRIFAQAESAFGKDSPEVCCIRASALLCRPVEVRDRNEVLKNVNIGLSKCKTPDYGLSFLKSKVLYGLKRYDESEKIAREGVERWNTLEWRFQLARALCAIYQEKSDCKALAEAGNIFAEYVREVPYDPNGYSQWGWCLSHQGHRPEAKAKFLKALDLDPQNEWAREKLKYVQ